MRQIAKRFGVAIFVFDLLIGVASAAVLHHVSSNRSGARMSSAQLEQLVVRSSAQATSRRPPAVDTSCTADPTGGWDYYCASSDGALTLYNVSSDRITKQSDLRSYR